MEEKITEKKVEKNLPVKKKKNVKIVIFGCLAIIILIIVFILGIYLGIVGKKWLENKGIIDINGNGTEVTSDGCLVCKSTVDNVDKSRFINVVDDVRDGVVTIAINDNRYKERDEQEANIGSGFVVDESGIIVTNHHVVEYPDYEYVVILRDGTRFTPQDIILDQVNDIAIIKVDPGETKLHALRFGNSDEVLVGEEVLAIGSALGEFTDTVTTGVVSGKNREISYYSSGVEIVYEDVIQTDAAINPGNSGGPLLNLSGEVIGVNFLRMMYVDNIGFCISSKIVKERVEEYKKYGRFEFPFLGVVYNPIDSFDVLFDKNLVEGALVTEVVSGSPAEKAGIVVGDIITQVDDTAVEGNLNFLIQKGKVGDIVKLEVFREGKYIELQATLASISEFD
ncbi:MAG TPA: trypsin-like peptidase domain-containing protein [Candidatus Dojkabacteria bacterium]|nr:trypsin-like peptidase domain-containing protein [Candidatus Dojkabacteria bacterium]HQF36105.1 trypsin-like peptidase domain-containing protein [Candidatus Dojkabacteria bacterium]